MWCLDPANSPELLTALRPHGRGHDFEHAAVGEGWRELVQECHRAVEARFPAYELLNVKQTDGVLRFQANPRPRSEGNTNWTSVEHAELSRITDSFQERSERVCEWCGASGRIRDERVMILALCDECDQRFSDPPVPGTD